MINSYLLELFFIIMSIRIIYYYNLLFLFIIATFLGRKINNRKKKRKMNRKIKQRKKKKGLQGYPPETAQKTCFLVKGYKKSCSN